MPQPTTTARDHVTPGLTPAEAAALLAAARLVAADGDTRAAYLPGHQGAALDRAVAKLTAAQERPAPTGPRPMPGRPGQHFPALPDDVRVRVLADDEWVTLPRAARTATVKLPGSFVDWLTATLADLGPAPVLDDVRATLDAARRTERWRGYFLTLDATAPVLEMLAALAADCVNLGRPATGHKLREAARTAQLRLDGARASLKRP